MAVEYHNRFGDTYYLHLGKTKTGKPKYYFAKKAAAEPVGAIPSGYEIRENPENGQVTLRKIRPTEISPLEKQMLSDGVRVCAKLKHFIVDVDGNSLVVYLPGMQEHEAARAVDRLVDPVRRDLYGTDAFAELLITRSHYSPMMRFTLADPDERLFYLERWCYLGSIDDWFPLAGPASLPSLIEKYAKHLGQESFYELA